MDPFEGKISSQIAWISAIAADEPYSMTGTITNNTGTFSDIATLPIGTQRFTLDYYLYDLNGNAIGGSAINMGTNLTGEETPQQYTSDANGLIRFYYGPKISVLTANITAIAVHNSSLKKSLTAKFVSSGASNLYLVVTPQTMASGEQDASTTRQAKVIAILSDDFGNPVTTSQAVTFTMSSPVTALYNTTADPRFGNGLTSETKTTDSSLEQQT